jgi:hypothetical protein
MTDVEAPRRYQNDILALANDQNVSGAPGGSVAGSPMPSADSPQPACLAQVVAFLDTGASFHPIEGAA